MSEKHEQRLEQTKPVLDGFYSWLETLMISGNTKFANVLTHPGELIMPFKTE